MAADSPEPMAVYPALPTRPQAYKKGSGILLIKKILKLPETARPKEGRSIEKGLRVKVGKGGTKKN